MCECDGDGPSIHHASTRTARKHYSCGECGTAIAPGDQYEYVFGVWNSDPDVFRTCAHCVMLRTEFLAWAGCSCWTYGRVLWEAEDAVADSGDLRATRAERRRATWKLAREIVRAMRRQRAARLERRAAA